MFAIFAELLIAVLIITMSYGQTVWNLEIYFLAHCKSAAQSKMKITPQISCISTEFVLQKNTPKNHVLNTDVSTNF